MGNEPDPVDERSAYGDGTFLDGIRKDGTLSTDQLERFIAETRLEPKWRRDADLCADYYDGNQLRPDTLAEMQERGIPPLIINLTRPLINAVLGLEEKNRSDWEVTSDDKPSEIVAQVLDRKLSDAQRDAQADRAISFAYGQQIKSGLGWVEVGYESNPFECRYRVAPVHRREIWWDWRDQSMDLRTARYLIRRRWFDADVLQTTLPGYEDLIKHAVNGWNGFIDAAFLNMQSELLGKSYEIERASTLDASEWRDTFRRRAQLFEVWYRVWKRGLVCKLPNGKVIEYDGNNRAHCEAVLAGMISPTPAVYPKMRQSIWIGPHRLIDRPTPYPHHRFPYVPFWGYKEDLTGAPHGLIRDMMSSQDEINARRSKLLSLLNSRRIEADTDAVDQTFNTIDDVADEVGRSDSVILLNPNRKLGANGFKVVTNMDLAQGQFATLKDSKDEMHEVSGIFPPTVGDSKQGLSGAAIHDLVDQSTTTLAMMNGHYRYGRHEVGAQLLELVRADAVHEEAVTLGERQNKTTIYINRHVQHPQTGDDLIENSVPAANVKMTLQDTPSTQSYRQKQFIALTEVAKSLPPNIQQLVVDFIIEASDITDREKIAERIRGALGIPDPDAPGGVDQRQLAAQQAHEAMVQKMTGLLQDMQRDRDLWKGKAESRVEAEQIRAGVQTAKIGADTIIKLDANDIARESAIAAGVKAGIDPAALQEATLEQIRPLFGALAQEIASLRQMMGSMAPPQPAVAPSQPTTPSTVQPGAAEQVQQATQQSSPGISQAPPTV